MFGNSPFNLPLPQGVLKTLGAESKVFEQQGQQGGQGGPRGRRAVHMHGTKSGLS